MGGFRWFQVISGWFQLVPGFSKYGIQYLRKRLSYCIDFFACSETFMVAIQGSTNACFGVPTGLHFKELRRTHVYKFPVTFFLWEIPLCMLY